MKSWTRLLAAGIAIASLSACDAATIKDLLASITKPDGQQSGTTFPGQPGDYRRFEGLWYGMSANSGPEQARVDIKVRVEGRRAFLELHNAGEGGTGPVIARGDADLEDTGDGKVRLVVPLQFEQSAQSDNRYPRSAKLDLRGDGSRMEGNANVTEQDGSNHVEPFSIGRNRPANWGQPNGYPSPDPNGYPSPDPNSSQSPDPNSSPSPEPNSSPSPDPTSSPSPSEPFPANVPVLGVAGNCGNSHSIPPDDYAHFGIADVRTLPNPWYGETGNPTANHWPVLFGLDSGMSECLLGTLPDGQIPTVGSGYGAAHLRFEFAIPLSWVGVEFLGGPLAYKLHAFDSTGAPIGADEVTGTATSNTLFLHVEHSDIRSFVIGAEANGGVLIRRIGAR